MLGIVKQGLVRKCLCEVQESKDTFQFIVGLLKPGNEYTTIANAVVNVTILMSNVLGSAKLVCPQYGPMR